MKFASRVVLFLLCAISFGCQADVPNSFVIIEFQNLRVNLFLEKTASADQVTVRSATPAQSPNATRLVLIGSGEAEVKTFRIIYSDKAISVNGVELSLNKNSVTNFVLTTDGKVEAGFLRNFK